MLPNPTSPAATRNFVFNPGLSQRTDQFGVRVDQNVGASDRLFFKYSFDKPDQVSPGTIYPASGAAIQVGPYLSTGGNGYATQVQTQSATVGLSHVFSPSLLLEAHVGVVRWYADVAPLGQGYASATAAGIPGINYSLLPFSNRKLPLTWRHSAALRRRRAAASTSPRSALACGTRR